MTSFCYKREALNKEWVHGYVFCGVIVVVFLTQIEAVKSQPTAKKTSVDSMIGKDDTDVFRKRDKDVFTDQKGR